MNCLEYRRAVLEDPAARDAGLNRHRLACRPCADWTARQQRLDSRIADALAVPVPDGLAERVLMRSAWQKRRPRWHGIAAGLVAVLAGAIIAVQLVDRPALADAVIGHIYHESELLLPGAQEVDPDRLQEVLARVGSRLEGSLGPVTHAGLCPINGRLAAHLVVAGEHGPVAVLIMPQHGVEMVMPVADDRLHGSIVPVGHGSVAIVGFRGEQLDELAERVRVGLSLPEA